MSQKQLTLLDLRQIFWKRKLWLVLPLVIVTGVAFGGSYLMPVVYSSSTKIVITPQRLVSHELESMFPKAGSDLPDARTEARWLASTRSEIASYEFIDRLITDLKLEPSEKITRAAAEMCDQFPDYQLQDIVRKLQIDDLKEKVGVGLIGENQILITGSSDDPKQAVDMATKLAEVYCERRLADEAVTAREIQTFTDQQSAIARRESDEAEKEIADFKNAYIANQLDAGISSQTNLGAVEAEVDATKLELKAARDRRNFLAGRLAQVGIDTSETLVSTAQLRAYIDAALATTTDMSKLMTKYLWSDGKIQRLQGRVADALNSLQAAANALAGRGFSDRSVSLQTDIGEMIYRSYEVAFLSGKEQILGEAIRQIKGVIAGAPYYDQVVARLQKNVDAKRGTYDKWQTQATGINILQATTSAEAKTKYRILEPASIALEPASPNRSKITLMGLALGLLLGCCGMVIAEVADHSVKTIEDIEQLLGYEVVGMIPKIEESTQVKKVRAA
jgi:uncharacterized protein involved in exopolysaccharide biosynthesis